ncbi:hypothetical protein F5X68DRAFT_231906 [Plectosphaerella plurivora]|uniref:Ecp2 effector protein-like domain-containing protein n=1 Tax=Plectosphaerella plurivora TaxID=936078 RepID=A0A9P8VDW8_9PEZI|nr:hypothetical protein F5X68DRAFT_231906 [Plectosphaerella plurivora]
MAAYRLAIAALIMPVIILTPLVRGVKAMDPCAMTVAPFDGANCRPITKPNGDEAALFLSNLYTSSHDGQGVCDIENSIFSGKSTNPDAALSEDCEALRIWLGANPGIWKGGMPWDDKWTSLATLDTCTFIAKPIRKTYALVAAADDVARFIEQGLDKHAIDGKLDVYGRSNCNNSYVDWRITGSKLLWVKKLPKNVAEKGQRKTVFIVKLEPKQFAGNRTSNKVVGTLLCVGRGRRLHRHIV